MKNKSELFNLLRFTEFEFGYTNDIDEYLKTLNEFEFNQTLITLYGIFKENFHNIHLTSILLVTFSRNDIPESLIHDIYFLANVSLSHHDLEVRECAIRFFEQQSSDLGLTYLKQVVEYMKPLWLKDYLEQVIKDLENNS